MSEALGSMLQGKKKKGNWLLQNSTHIRDHGGETSCQIKSFPSWSSLFCLCCVSKIIEQNVHYQFKVDFVLLSSSGNPLGCSVARHFSVSRLLDHSTRYSVLLSPNSTVPRSPRTTLWIVSTPFKDKKLLRRRHGNVMEFGHSLTSPDQSLHFLYFSFSLLFLPYLAPVHRCPTFS